MAKIRAWPCLALAAATALPASASGLPTAEGEPIPVADVAVRARAHAIPAFARKYRTSCLTCHVMPPRLNAGGEAFRLNGYQVPLGDAELIQDSAVTMGAPEWAELFPEAVWPSTLPGLPPLAVRVIADYENRAHTNSSFRFPVLFQLLMGGTFGDDLGFFVEATWAQGSGASLSQAFLKFQDVLRFAGLPERALNLWVGKLDQNLLPSYRFLESVYREAPLWSSASVANLRVDSAGTDRTSSTAFRLRDRQPGFELNGILQRRLAYAVGVTQGVEAGTDVDNHKDLYYAVRAKIGGRPYDGSGRQPEGGLAARWVDNAVQLEHFAYFGRQREDPFRRFGLAVRWSRGDLETAAGYVWGKDDRPWAGPGHADYETWFWRADYMVLPWVMASLRFEDLAIDPVLPPGWQVTPGGEEDVQRVLPTVTLLLRANMRLVLEGNLYTRDASVPASRRAHTFASRLDFAF